MSATLLQRYSFNGTLTGEGSLNLALQNISTTLGTPTYTTGPVAGTQALAIPTSGQYLELPYNVGLNFSSTSSWSYGGWIYDTSGVGYYFSNVDPSITMGQEFQNYQNNTYYYYYTPSQISIGASAGYALNTWVHWWITYDGSVLRFYRSGTLYNTSSTVISTKNFGSSLGWIIAKSRNPNQTIQKLTGAVADIRWYSGVVSPSVAMTQIVAAPVLLQQYAFNGNLTASGSVAVSPNVTGTPTYTSGPLTNTQGIVFSPTCFMILPYTAALDFGPTTPFSIGGWRKTSDSGQVVMLSNETFTGRTGISFISFSSTNGIGTNFWTNNSAIFMQPSVTSTLGVWTHLWLTFDGTTARQYVNGVQTASATVNTNFASKTQGWQLNTYFGTAKVDQAVADVRWYSGVVAPTIAQAPIVQILKSYNFNFNFSQIKPVYANIGIGTNNPQKTLDINGDINISKNIYNNSSNAIFPWNKNSNLDTYFNSNNGNNSNNSIGNVGIGKTNPVYLLDVNGDIKAQTFIDFSDMILKENIIDENLGLEFINTLQPKTFKYIDTTDNKLKHGLIAQDLVESGYSNFVGIDDIGYLSLQITSLIGPMVNSIKELSDKNVILKHKIESYKSNL
jgi:hypothetical protein